MELKVILSVHYQKLIFLNENIWSLGFYLESYLLALYAFSETSTVGSCLN